ncbi:MAG: Channel protein hemolysin III family [candidate division TA06 bacterium 34_109]|uniref:Channel protein hemolysin III family n=1 Tax=candidate division TA06 bacterium 34_109 TaxID=1635277 RepID=A0A101HYU7_UNCT6|nr:MAG: Channel protein hemolysin III family [candidate division TA06 bacterium 34_109]
MNKKYFSENATISISSERTQEMTNSITHGIGAILSIVGLITLLLMAVNRGDIWRIVSFTVYGATLVFLYLCSTVYHGLSDRRKKYIFQILDHVAIYLLIAGSYTPLTLLTLRGPWGWSLLGIIWGMAFTGILLKIFFFQKTQIISMILYIIMGWLIIVAIKPLLEAISSGMLYLIVLVGYATLWESSFL